MATPVEDVKARLDAVDYIGRDVRLQRAGRNWKGLCPFHTEKTPSFYVFPDRGNFKCFGCSEGGDLLTYVMRRDGVEFPDALHELGREAGIDISQNLPNRAQRQQRTDTLTLLEKAKDFLHGELVNSSEASGARAYIQSRGISQDICERFSLGYAAPRGSPLLGHLRDLGYEDSTIESAGLARSDEHGTRDYLFDRLIFPIWDRSGSVVGFGGRTLRDVEPKYLNTRDSPVFTKGHHLYALNLARDAIRESRVAVIVEGYMDAIAASQAGFANTVASMGTSLTIQQAQALTSAGANNIIIALDADAAGAAATRRGLDVLRETGAYEPGTTVDVRGLVRHEDRLTTNIGIAELPAGEDPDSLIRSNPTRWLTLTEKPTPMADFAFRWAGQEHDLTTHTGRKATMRELLPIVSEIGDVVVRSHYFERLATLSGVPSDELRRVATRNGRRSRPRSGSPTQPTSTRVTGKITDRLEEGLLEYVVRADPKMARLISQLDPENLTDPMSRHMLTCIIADIHAHNTMDWDRIEASLDPDAQQRLQAIRDQAAELPITTEDLGTALQYTTLRLRLRRLNSELEETKLATGEDPSASPHLAARIQQLHVEIHNVHRAQHEFSEPSSIT